jgi:TetR/AcrR family transcriptional regulator, transcriptional repressor of aconitase
MPKVTDEYRDARRAHVLAAARRCFVRDGFHATSMTDICRAAGVSSGVIYLYFSSKDDIIAAIAEQNLGRIAGVAQDLVRRHGGQGAGTVFAQLLAYIRAEHERDGLASIALLAWSESLRNDVLAERLRDALTTVRGLFAELLRVQEGPARPGPMSVDEGAALFVSILVGYVMQLATQPPDAVAPVTGAVASVWGPA